MCCHGDVLEVSDFAGYESVFMLVVPDVSKAGSTLNLENVETSGPVF